MSKNKIQSGPRLKWSTGGGGHYEDASGRYQIFVDCGTWVLTRAGSIVRYYSTLADAQIAAEIQEANGVPVCFEHSEYITHGQIIPCAVGWVIVYKQPLGLWTEVAGPFSTREKARHAQKEAWDNYCQHTHARQGGKG